MTGSAGLPLHERIFDPWVRGSSPRALTNLAVAVCEVASF
jgi:hypothetical protein